MVWFNFYGMISRKCGIKKCWQFGSLVDPLCQQSTEEHLHSCLDTSVTHITDCGWYIMWLKVMVHIYVIYIYCPEIYFDHRYILLIDIAQRYILLMDIFCSQIYFAHRYILLIDIFCSQIYPAHKYNFDASMLWKEMVEILLFTSLELS